jgi:glycosyltransferase involved in cell wall biosynthesis
MRILVLNYRDITHPLAGGAEVHLHEVFGRIVKLGHSVMLFTTSYKGALEREIIDGIDVIRCGSDALFQINVLRKIPKLIKEFNADIVFEDLNKLPLFSPCITKLPILIQIQHLWRLSIFREAFFPVALVVWIGERLIPFIYKNCPFVTASPSAFSELRELGVKQEISIVYHGTDLIPQNEEWTKDKSLYFMWLGRFRKYKGVWIALKAFKIFAKKYPDVELFFAGSGPEEKKLRAKAKEWGLENRVKFLGYVDNKEKLKFMNKALALLQTSYKEGWGLTVIEAGGVGTTTIASRVSGLCDSVKDGETGLLFKVGDFAECADLMEKIYINPPLREKLESEAKHFASSFDWNKSARETLDILSSIVNKNK